MKKKNKTLRSLILLLTIFVAGVLLSFLVSLAFKKLDSQIINQRTFFYKQNKLVTQMLNNILVLQINLDQLLREKDQQKYKTIYSSIESNLACLFRHLDHFQDSNHQLNLNKVQAKKMPWEYGTKNNKECCRYTPIVNKLSTNLYGLKALIDDNIPGAEHRKRINEARYQKLLNIKNATENIALYIENKQNKNEFKTNELRHLYSKTKIIIYILIPLLILLIGLKVSNLIIQDQKELKKASDNIYTILKALPVGIIIVDSQKKIKGVNQKAIQIFQTDSENDFLNRNYADIISNDETKFYSGKTETISLSQTKDIVTFRGQKLTILLNSIPIEMGEETLLLQSFMDITKLKQTELELEVSAKTWQNTFDAMRDMIVVMDTKMNIICYNKAMLEAFPQLATKQFHCHEIIHGCKITKETCIGRKSIETGEPQQGEIQSPILNDHWIDIRVFPVKDENGKVIKLIHTFRDITDIKNYQNQILEAKNIAEKASKAKSLFLSMMSHEIRTPLNGVIGMTELLAETDLNEEQRDFLRTIQVSGEALMAVINDILDYSKIESGKLELESKPFELAKVLEDTVDLMLVNAVSKNIDLLYNITSETPPFIEGDITRLRQIVINLVGNAIKFTKKGEVFIEVKTYEDITNKKVGDKIKLLFCVKDTGIGISKSGMSKLFKDFSQVDSSTTRKYGGTGLGLAISKKLVNMMNGDIWVESEFKKGTSFFFTISTTIAEEQPRDYLQHNIQELKNKKILIVDDNQTNRKILNMHTVKWGLIPYESSSADDAMNILQKDKEIKIAIIDMHMPEKDGYTFALEIRNNLKDRKMKLIMLSSMGYANNKDNIMQVFDAYLNKPAKQALLYSTLLNCVKTMNDNQTKTPIQKIELKPKTSSPESTTTKDKNDLKILVAEDNLINRKLAGKMIENLGYNAVFAKNGAQAVEQVTNNDFDIVFMDCQMPVLDGYSATKAIRELGNEKKDIPIIAMTANAMEGDKEVCINAGMNDYISKPIKKAKIQEMLDKWCKA